MNISKALSILSIPASAAMLGTAIWKFQQKPELGLFPTHLNARFVLDHHFSNLEYTGGKETENISFQDSVNGFDPKIKGKYYLSWTPDNGWNRQLESIKNRKDFDARKISENGELTKEKLKQYCADKSKKKLIVTGRGNKYRLEQGEEKSSPKEIQEWKDAVIYCTSTISTKEYFEKQNIQRINRKEELGANNIQSLISEDERRYENASMEWGREYLQDKLKEKSVEGARETVFEWCRILGEKPASTGTWNQDKDNFRTYCTKGN